MLNKNASVANDTHPEFQNAGTIPSGLNRNIRVRSVNQFEQVFAETSRTKKLLANQLLGAQTDQDFARLLPHLEPVSLAAGETLFDAGEKIRFLYFPEDAAISNLQAMADGGASEIALVGSEGMIGLGALFGSCPPAYSAEVTLAGTALRIKTEVLKQEFDHSARLQAVLLNYANSHIAQISQRAVCHIHHLAEARFCSWLLMLQDRAKNNLLPLTQDRIALHLGVNRPSVTHIAQALRERGIINYVRGYINILNRRGLEDSACECYSVIKENFQTIPL